MKIRLISIYEKAKHRPSGYIDDCIAHGRVIGDFIEFSDDAWRYLCRRYRMIDPNPTDLDDNYFEATLPLKSRGFEIVEESIYRARVSECSECSKLPEYRCPVCANNPVRHYWKHAQCPMGKWK